METRLSRGGKHAREHPTGGEGPLAGRGVAARSDKDATGASTGNKHEPGEGTNTGRQATEEQGDQFSARGADVLDARPRQRKKTEQDETRA